ncbi:uncharacterized protein EI90DRAFT_1576455 [Cantharellus anzutake]|uniref:uncharacterized protein n=1 Tax=Cantharellus anzutake TaxID=1750568 RepID=UPI0019051487|nr:uncharacterized protein EI90DRAFT_1576455 [Cantharellus anzutake]KAF8328424.1 hypothetical protein EI90DRAFT_1576455 [Cantharellus anzutake]
MHVASTLFDALGYRISSLALQIQLSSAASETQSVSGVGKVDPTAALDVPDCEDCGRGRYLGSSNSPDLRRNSVLNFDCCGNPTQRIAVSCDSETSGPLIIRGLYFRWRLLDIWLWNADTGTRALTLDLPSGCVYMAFAPDGLQLACGSMA